jgi:hypothetical protein
VTSKHIEELLQQCIAAFDSGISPEECLGMFPAQRAELEPLFRQAISLRVAFAAAPRAEFRQQTRERVLFMAGRDVTAALSARPDPEFIKDARQRFIRAAGAEAQEALRAVPPPRMPFWANTRRRLLERAAETNSNRRPVARPMGGVMALRAGMSMAAVALIIAVGAFVYSISLNETPASNAQLAQLEKDLADLQRDHEQNGVIDKTQLQNVTAKINELVQQSEPAPAVVEKLPELISKQRQVVTAAANEGLLAPEVAQAQNQQLQEAQAKAELRLAAARAEDPTSTPQPQPSASATAPSNTATTPVASTPTPVVTPPPADEPVSPGQIRVTASADTAGAKKWKTIELSNMSFNVPDSWKLGGGIELDEGNYGFAPIDLETILINTDGNAAQVRVNVNSGRIDVFTNGTQITLRVGGVNGAFISIDELVAKAGPLVGDLRNLQVTFEPAGALVPQPTPTPSPTPANTATPTATPTSTATPPPTSSPAPSATP